MHHKQLTGSWLVDNSNPANSTAVGCNNYKNYLKNPMFKFEIVNPGSSGATTVKFTARLQCVGGTSYSMNLSVFPLQNIGGHYVPVASASPKKHGIATSCGGIYSDNTCGVAVYNIELSSKSDDTSDGNGSGNGSGYYCLLPSTFGPNEVSQFSIDVYVSNAKYIRFL